jgi:HEAT repeat protein
MRERRLICAWAAILIGTGAAIVFFSHAGGLGMLGAGGDGPYLGKTAGEWAAMLKSNDEKTRRKAILNLSWAPPDGENPLPVVAELASSPDDTIRLDAVRILASLGHANRNALAVLIGAMKDASPAVRLQAVYALNTLGAGGQEAIPAVIERLSDESLGVRQQAARWLGTMEEDARAAVPALLEMWRGPNLHLQHAAAAALWNIDPQTARREHVARQQAGKIAPLLRRGLGGGAPPISE